MLAQQWLDDPDRAGHTEAKLEVRLDVGILDQFNPATGTGSVRTS